MKTKSAADFCRRYFFLFGMILLSVCYLFFPCNNPSCDAVNYAADVKYGVDLFWPHHLIYNAFHFCIYKFCGLFYSNIDAMSMMNVVTAIFSIATLLVSWRILLRITEKSSAESLVLLLGSCFGFMRYSVQCETYVIPIFFSVVASYFFLKCISGKHEKMYAAIAGLLSVMACLFHEVQIFWTIGIMFGFLFSKRYKCFAIYIICLLLIPVAYSLSLVFVEGSTWTVENLVKYAMSYYFSDASSTGIGWKNLLMSPISFVRSISQVHGNFLLLLKMFPYLYAMFLLIPIMFWLIVMIFRRSCKINGNRLFAFVHLGIFAMQFIFACFSDGNTEFMVMLPFALVFCLASLFCMPGRFLLPFGVSLFVWNFVWAILPEHICDYYNESEVVLYLRSNPDCNYIAAEEQLVENLYFYKYGESIEGRVFGLDDEIPNGEYVTDVVDRQMPLNRNKMLNGNTTFCFENAEPLRSVNADFGGYHLFRVNYMAK